MRIQISAIGDALVDHVSGIVDRFLKVDDSRQTPTASREPPQAITPTPTPSIISPDVSYLRDRFVKAIRSFNATVERVKTDNPADIKLCNDNVSFNRTFTDNPGVRSVANPSKIALKTPFNLAYLLILNKGEN